MAVAPANLRTLRNKNCLAYLHLNARSLENKQDDIDTHIDSTGVHFDAIMIWETWYTRHTVPFTCTGYQTFVLDRPQRRGGGVLLLVNRAHEVQVLEEFTISNENYEILTVQNGSKIISVVYWPPNAQCQSFL